MGGLKAMHAEGEMPAPVVAWNAGWPKTDEEFRTLVGVYSDRLVGYAFRRVGNLQDAEDVVQDVFVSTYRLPPSRRSAASRSAAREWTCGFSPLACPTPCSR